MGSMKGHVFPGFGFLVIGMWHLYNHIRLHARGPSSYSSPVWFPFPRIRYLELYLIMFGASMSVLMELFVGPRKHQPLDPDGTIPSTHLHNFEHSLISLSIFTYAAFAIIFDRAAVAPTRAHARASTALTQLVAAVAFGQELLLFHLHSTDHAGLEGHYHMFLQLLILVSLTTTVLGIGLPRSFLVSFLRSVSIVFQGIWLNVVGYMLWTPQLIPKGCFMKLEDAHYVVHCHSDEALHRAKSLVNIEFSFYLIGVTVFSMSLYLVLTKKYSENVEYQSLDPESTHDMELPKIIKFSLDDEQLKTPAIHYPTAIIDVEKYIQGRLDK